MDDYNDEIYDRLVTQIKQRLAHGQTRDEIIDDFKNSVPMDDLFLAYQSAKILHYDDVELENFGKGYVCSNGKRYAED